MPDLYEIEYDTARLLALARRAREAKALARAENDRTADLRDRLADLTRRAANARQNADLGGPRDAIAYREQADALDTEIAQVRQQLADANSESSELGASAGSAARTFQRALRFAVEADLGIPSELSSDAAAIRHGFHPDRALAQVAK